MQLGEDGQAALEIMKSAGESDGSFRLPANVVPLRTLLTFHLHGGESTEGALAVAGPSSGYHGLYGDRGHAWKIHQDDVVFTRLDAKRFNADFYTGNGVVIDLGNYELP